MMDIDKELYILIHKYNLDIEYPEYYQKILIKELINDLFNSFDDNNICSLYCGGFHTLMLYDILDEKNRKKIKYIIDEKSDKTVKYNEWIYIKPNCIPEKKIDKIIISSFIYETEIKLLLTREGYEWISIYDWLREKGVFLTTAFYEYQEKSFTYMDLFILRNMYKKTKNYKILEKMIFACLMIRDFISAFQYIELYIQSEYTDFLKYINFKNELNKLLEEIKGFLDQRKEKDIIINWIDGVNYNDARNMQIIGDKDGVYFSNAYNVIPYTGSVMTSMMTGQYELVSSASRKDCYNQNNCILIKELKRKNYEFLYLGYRNMLRNRFDDEYLFRYNSEIRQEIKDALYIGTSTFLQWEIMNCLINSQKPMCLIVHSMIETHLPFRYTDVEHIEMGDIFRNSRWDSFFEERYSGGVCFIDKQLMWYKQFYNNAIRIYMTDHGPGIDRKNYEDDRTHIALKIYGIKKNKDEYRLFSLVNFWKLLVYCIDETIDYNDLFSDYIIHEALNIYDENGQKTIIDWLDNNDKRKTHARRYLMYRAVRTHNDLYVEYLAGEKRYYRDGNFNKDYSKEQKYEKRISYLKSLIGDSWKKEITDDKIIEIYNKVKEANFDYNWW